MDKRVKWGIIILVGAGLIGLGIHNFTPKENEELNEASPTIKTNKKKSLNVNAQIIKPHLLTDQLFVSGKLMPDEEVDLSFETSGKIIDINFTEGSFVTKGQLLAKVNDSQLQAQLDRLKAQMPLAEDRVFRQNALLQRDAVSKEAYEQVKTELATLHADIQNLLNDFAQIGMPFDNVDTEYLLNPKKWNTSEIKKNMFIFGTISTIFDLLCFLALWVIMKFNTIEKST